MESEPGKGTTFRLYLPRLHGAEEAGTVGPIKQTEHAQAGPVNILVVEDETSLRRLICTSLERHGHTVFGAKDGVEALGIFRQHAEQIRLVVSDLIMPRMDGLQLKEHIATLRNDVRFLFMSGYAEQLVEQHRGSLNGSSFLEKPFLLQELAEKVSGLLGRDVAA